MEKALDSSRWKSLTIDENGCRVSTEDDDRKFAEAWKNGEVMTFYEAIQKPLNDWKRQQTNTPVKRRQYHGNMMETFFGRKYIIPNSQKLRTAIKKAKNQ